jgi:hypothetical protein
MQTVEQIIKDFELGTENPHSRKITGISTGFKGIDK